MIAVLLILIVSAVWFAQLGFVRLATPLSRLHVVTAIYVAAGVATMALAVVTDGASVRAVKAMLILACALVGGAATSHAIGRALWLRGSVGPARPDP
ncbi:MAG TPA: monovalent cation/H(+) antiporter subunit G [Rhodopila sp.]|uniref:monovalent cation/H(+) antiporter subunit G n=1 Tax=Rhodopila sp. TaxID=2480087 RepID=UPI002B868E2D|nr:monovalent cation/H(+) antiporter subunit G [Rhodopila sp.]HVY13976.1 monovalent cation/H(+) antiporter subunit G [Rhodopila sp.]